MTILPDLVLENIFERIVESDGDCAILNLSLVCRRWKDIVASDTFRRNVHFQWLSKVYTHRDVGGSGTTILGQPGGSRCSPRVAQIVVPERPHIPVWKEEPGPYTCVVSDLFSIEEM